MFTAYLILYFSLILSYYVGSSIMFRTCTGDEDSKRKENINTHLSLDYYFSTVVFSNLTTIALKDYLIVNFLTHSGQRVPKDNIPYLKLSPKRHQKGL